MAAVEMQPMRPPKNKDVTFDDQLFQEYQAGYHKGYEHGINDASLVTAEDVMLISDLEFFELNNEENKEKSRHEIYEKIAARFNKERYKNRNKKL